MLHATTFDSLRANIVLLQAGDPTTNKSDANTQTAVTSIYANGESLSMQMKQTATSLFASCPSLLESDGKTTNIDGVSCSLENLHTMALAYAIVGNNPPVDQSTIGRNVVAGVNFIVLNYYTASAGEPGNAYTWEILSSNLLGAIGVLMRPSVAKEDTGLTPIQLASWAASIDHFDPLGTTTCLNTPCTGANLAGVKLSTIYSGLLKADGVAESNQIAQAVSDMAPLFLLQPLANAPNPDGFYTDGSFIQHTTMAYTIGYGSNLFGNIAAMANFLNGPGTDASWQFSVADLTVAYNWIVKSFEPLIYSGAAFDAENGRNVADVASGTNGPSDHGNWRYIVQNISLLALRLSGAQQDSLAAFAKQQAALDMFSSSYQYNAPALYAIKALETLLANQVAAAGLPTGMYNFPSMQRLVDQESNYAFSLSLFSQKINAFEDGGPLNALGFYEGVGTAFLYNADQTQYSRQTGTLAPFWPNVNIDRLPGVTTDGPGTGKSAGYSPYLNTAPWVGTSTLNGHFGSAGMHFSMANVTTSNLSGYKSWFFLGNKMVALGASISGGGMNTETIVENRKLHTTTPTDPTDNDNTFVVNGTTMSTALTNTSFGQAVPHTSILGVNWAWLAETNGSATTYPNWSIGYYFAGSPTLNVLRESRTGSSSDLSLVPQSQASQEYTSEYLSIAYPEGCSVAGCTPPTSSYAYAVLPNFTQTQTQTYAAAPDFVVLHNSSYLQAVLDTADNVVGANFLLSTGGTLTDAAGSNYLAADASASITTQETAHGSTGEIDLGISDPTQSNAGTLHVTLNRSATGVVSVDPGVTVTQMSPQVKLSINVNGALGRTFSVKLTEKLPTASGSISTDADVQDRNPNTNYGSEPTLYVKSAGINYTDHAYLKLKVADFSGLIGSAHLQLVPIAQGVTNLSESLDTVSNVSWSESTIDYTNAPAIGTQITSFPVTTLNQAITLDVTAQAIAAQTDSSGGYFSVAIVGPTCSGVDCSVTFGSKDNATIAYRPMLVLSR